MSRTRLTVAYDAAITAAGVVCISAIAALGLSSRISGNSAELWAFSACLLIGETFPVTVPLRGGESDSVTVSTIFTFAILLAFGVPTALLAQVVCSVIADALYRKSIGKILFNASQYAICVGAAGAVYGWLGGSSSVSGATLVPLAGAAITFYLLNTALVDLAIAFSTGIPSVPYLRKDLAFQAFVAPPLAVLAPVAVVAADKSLWLVPLLLVPAISFHRGAQMTQENAKLVERLRTNLERANELNRMKDDFVAVVSHELRTPLTSIQGYVKTLLQLAPQLDQEQARSFLEAADRQSDRLRRLIEQLLVVSRLDENPDALEVSEVSLSHIVSVVIDELRPRSDGHVFDVRIDPSADPARTDAGKLHQIVSNLVENAIKYSPPDTRVKIEVEPSVGGVVLLVEDEGSGIPPEAQERIFERFYQVDSSATRRVGGTGLGLYICRRLSEDLGARLWLMRSDGTGSEFCLFLPLAPRDADGGDEEPAMSGRNTLAVT